MIFLKEPYRKFEKKLWAFKGAFDVPTTNENTPVTPKAEVQNQPIPTDIHPTIAEHRADIHNKITELEAGLPNEQKEAAKSFFDTLRLNTTAKFNTLITKYDEAKAKIGNAFWEGSEAQEKILEESKQLAKELRGELEKKDVVEKMVKEYLNKVPNLSSNVEEEQIIMQLIREDAELTKDYGNDFSTPEQQRVIKAIGKKYDIKWNLTEEVDEKTGEKQQKMVPSYGIDVSDPDHFKVYSGEELKQVITTELKRGDYSNENIQATEKKIESAAKKINRLTKEIQEGSAFAMGGEIKKIEDWQGHKGVEELNRMMEGLDKGVQDALGKNRVIELRQEMLEETEKQWQEYLTVLEVSGVQKKFDEAEAKGYKHLENASKKPNREQRDFTSKEVLKNENNTLTFEIDQGGVIVLTINSVQPSFETVRSFKDPEEFAGIDLVEEVNIQTQTLEKNRKIIGEIEAVLYSIKNVEVTSTNYPDNLLINPNFSPDPWTFSFNGHEIGGIEATGENRFKFYFKGQEPLEEVSGEELQKIIDKNLPAIKVMAETGEKTKTEMAEKAKGLEKLKKRDNPKVELVEPSGDFLNPEGKIMVGQIKRPDDSVAGTIFLPVSIPEGAGDRSFEIEAEGIADTVICDFEQEIDDFIDHHQELLIKTPEKLTEPGKEIKEKTRHNVDKLLARFFPELKGQNNEEVTNKFLNLLSELHPTLLKRISEMDDVSEVTFEERDQKNINAIMLKAMGIDRLEKPDEKEVKLIAELALPNGQKFGDLLGENVVKMVSMAQEVWSYNGETTMKGGDGKALKATPELLISKLPTDIKIQCQLILSGQLPEGFDMAKFKELSGLAAGKLEAMTVLKEAMAHPNFVKNLGERSGIEWFEAIFQSLPLILKWIGEGDIRSATDAFEAIQNNPDGVEGGIAEAKKAYEEGLKEASLSDLLEVHKKPTGDKANELFTEKRFRGQLRDIVQEHVVKSLGQKDKPVEFESWDTKDNALTVVAQGRRFKVRFEPAGNKDVVEMGEITPERGLNLKVYGVENGLNGTDRTLQNAFAQVLAIPPPAPEIAPAPAAETPAEPKKAEKPKAQPTKKPAQPKKDEVAPAKPEEVPASETPAPASDPNWQGVEAPTEKTEGDIVMEPDQEVKPGETNGQ